MTKFVSSLAALALFGSFAAISGAFASTQDGAKLVVNVNDQTVEALEPTVPIDAVESPRPTIGLGDEPSPAWTRADCVKAWKMNMMGCNASPPNLRPACWAAASALMAACVAASKG